jgi:hypothetical protein
MPLDPVRSTHAHDARQHPLDQAHSAVATPTGALVYVVCGHLGCAQRRAVDAAVWEAELARRAALSQGVQVWHARGDRLVPVAPDVDGRLPEHATPGRRRP